MYPRCPELGLDLLLARKNSKNANDGEGEFREGLREQLDDIANRRGVTRQQVIEVIARGAPSVSARDIRRFIEGDGEEDLPTIEQAAELAIELSRW